jgi:hypothetical protein
MIVLAVIVWRRGRNRESRGIPKWLSAAGSLGPWSAFGLALILNIRPKGILLSAAAGLSIRGDDLTVQATAIVIVIYTVISASAVAVLIIASLVNPTRTGRWLVDAKDWVTRNNLIVSVLIMILIGTVIVGNGLARL